MRTLQVTFEDSPRYKGVSYEKLLDFGYDVELVGMFDANKLKGSPIEVLVRDNLNSDIDPFSLPEICCYLGHLYAWNKLLESGDEYCLIVEDDAIPLVGPDIVLSKIKSVEFFDAIQLVTRESNYIDYNEQFLRGFPCGYGLISYVLSRKGAKALIDQQNLKAADLKLMELSMNGVVLGEKECSFEHDWSIPSTIQNLEL